MDTRWADSTDEEDIAVDDEPQHEMEEQISPQKVSYCYASATKATRCIYNMTD
jgi:hypothetical protein